MNKSTADWCKSLPKPDDREGWSRRHEQMFQSIFGPLYPDIPKPATPEPETQK